LVGSASVVALAPSLALAFATLALVRRPNMRCPPSADRRPWPALFVVLGFALGAARAHHAIDSFERARVAALPERSGVTRMDARGVVASSPVELHGVPRFDVDFVEPSTFRATVYGGPAGAARGDEVTGVVQLGPPDRFDDPDIGDARVRETRRGVLRTGSAVDLAITARAFGVRPWIDHQRDRVRRRIEATFPETTAPLARALVLGETDLDAADDDAFRASGLAHLLAVSGMHLVLVVLGAVALFRALLLRVTPLSERVDVGRIAAAIAIPFCWAYSDFAGGSGSAVRASWMLSAALLARALCHRTYATRTLGLSVLGALAFDPLALFDVSFMLSACATAGLVAFSKPLAEKMTARMPELLHKPLEQIAVTISATIPCAPVLATFAPQLPLGSAAANLLAVPLGETAALPLCLVHALLSPAPFAERGCALAASGALGLVRTIARFFGGMTALQLPVPTPGAWQLAAIAFAFAAIAWARRSRGTLVALAVMATVLFELPQRVHPHDRLRVTFVDVGQGDAALVDLPDGSAMLVDGGGIVGSPLDVGKRVIAPLLRARRRDALALVVLTHPHPDHFGGLDAGLAGVRVAELWDTAQGEREGVGGAYANVLARARLQNTHIARPAEICGTHVIGGARIDVLAPCPAALPERPPNDNSFVLRVAYGKRAFLFVGDAEREEEAELVQRYGGALRADVLKVGHHGSKTSSTPAFVAAVAPKIAVVSCGIRNRYGHPFPTTIETLRAAGARIHRTDRRGAVVVATDGASLTVDGSAEEP
ncbi:MAG TPA: DNA internalization-related competence protein ComEC/Rec2, partial [Polyangiaceae bacterium]|nr:DNA internalization-related competence protein ComEC/Rec2 [Polyangiaceae bacterium]